MNHHRISFGTALCLVLCLLFSPSFARDLDPNYKFGGIKAPESPYKNTWSAFQTDLFSGSFSYNFNIEVPPGTNGFAPKITLSYNSHSAKGRPGWLGSGWEIPQSYIQRDIEYTRKNTADDTFDLYLNGAKHDLVYVPSEGRFHTKIETFLKIEKLSGAPNQTGEYWLVTAKDGTQFRFGYTPDAENMAATTDPEMTPCVWRWSLDQAGDSNGNPIYYRYTEIPGNGEVYLSRVEYNSERKRVVEFVLTERTDQVGTYLYVEQGSEIIETKKLSEIRVSVNGALSRKYVMNYQPNESRTSLLLTSVTPFGSDGTTSLPPVKFEYNSLHKGFSQTQWKTPGSGKYIRKFEKDGDMYYDTMDMNGDGLPDYVKYDEGDRYWAVWLNEKTGFSPVTRRWDTFDEIRYIQDVREESGKATNTRSSMMDFNRDGHTDLVWADGTEDYRECKYVLNGPDNFGEIRRITMPFAAWIRNSVKVNYDRKGKPDKAPNVEQSFFDINGTGCRILSNGTNATAKTGTLGQFTGIPGKLREMFLNTSAHGRCIILREMPG